MTSKGHALSRDALVRTLTAYSGITTEDGEADGTTLVDSNLIDRNDFISEKTILIMSGDAKDEDKGALSFVSGTGKITLQGTGFSAQIKAGTVFRVLNISTVEIDVANMDAKIGTNTDAAGTTTLFAWLARLFAVGGQGLVYYGKVTQVDDVTHFRVAGLTGFGDAYFANTYRVYVVRDAAGGGADPQGKMQPCSAYDSTDGIFTHTAFTVSLAVDDEVLLLHERIAEIKDLIDRLGAFTATENLKAILGNLSTTKNLGGILGALTATDNLKAILGAYDAAAPLKTAIDAIISELLAVLDLAGGATETSVMDGTEKELYKEEAGTVIRLFAGINIDWTGLNAGGGEDTTIKAYRKYEANWRKFYEETFLATAVPDPPVTPVPRDLDTQCTPSPVYYKQGIKITAQQAAVGAGWNTLTFDKVTAAPGA